MKGILKRMSEWLLQEDKSEYGSDCFGRLEQALEAAELCAAENYNNALFHKDTYELDYMKMRQRQSVILKEIYNNIKSIEQLPEQTEQVAALLVRIEQDYHRDNTVTGLLEVLEQLFMKMKEEPLPESREEFESRAILYYILKQIQNLLEVKRDFMKS